MIPYTTRTACRSCGGSSLEPVLSLGETPLANALVTSANAPDERVPLDVVFCRDCTLVQITEDVPPEILFRDYVYFSSFSDTVLANARALTSRLIDERHLDASSLVLEIASNDGYLLRNYVERGVPVLGVEPATNIAAVAERNGVRTIAEFFTRALAEGLPKADVVHANNVLAHVGGLNDFVAGIAAVLKPDGVAVIEVPYVRELIERLEFDTIYHEHLCYFSATALDALFTRHGLHVVDVERIPIHGGSLRVSVAHSPRPQRLPLLAEEASIGMCGAAFYRDFGRRVEALCASLRRTLEELKRQGKTIAAYGASAKGTTLLAFAGIGAETLDFVADRSTVKQGKFTPGTRLPILPPESLVDRMPDYVLLLSWNFADEILRQQEEYRRRGGRLIIPLPEVKVV